LGGWPAIVIAIVSVSILIRQGIEVIGLGRDVRRKKEPDIRKDTAERYFFSEIKTKTTTLVKIDFEQTLIDIRNRVGG
jgi:hypothetical protein